jgi:SNF2 family DNA or RNA helicase
MPSQPSLSPTPVSAPDLTALVLHAVWLPGADAAQAMSLLLWAEAARTPKAIGPGGRDVHPFAASGAELLRRLPFLPEAQSSGRRLVLPALGAAPAASHALIRDAIHQTGEASGFAFWRVEGVAAPPRLILSWLLSLDDAALAEAGILLSDDARFWRAAARLAWEIVMGDFYLPRLESLRGTAHAVWRPLLDAPGVAERVHALANAMPPACFSSAMAPTGVASTDAATLLASFLDAAVDITVRAAAGTATFIRPHSRTAADFWLGGLSAPGSALRLGPQEAELVESALGSWTRRLEAALGGGLRACLKLVPPPEENAPPKKKTKRPAAPAPWRLDFALQAAADPSVMASAADVWAGGDALEALRSLATAHPEERLLTALEAAGRVFPPVAGSLAETHPTHCELTAAQAHRFLKEAAPLLAASGFGVFLPPWWKSGASLRLGVRLKVAPRAQEGGALGLSALLDFDWRLALGDTPLTDEEFNALSKAKEPLLQFRGQWVEINPDNLRQATAFWNRQKGSGLKLSEVFERLGAGAANSGIDITGIEAGGWVNELLNGPSADHEFTPVPVPGGFHGELRPYQSRGLSWLAFLRRHGFGACLADDMGLGKTVQTLAFLLHEKENGRLNAPALLVCPTSVVGNWLKETERFAPALRARVHHGGGRATELAAFHKEAEAADLVVTTYALARKDARFFRAREWSGVILDEAQSVKNPHALQSVAVRALKGDFRLALTGTPLENRLAELWSIMEFLNPGYLGPLPEFHRRFSVPIERFRDAHAADVLRRLAQPFILRRLKTDPHIVSDLPPKMEMKVYCTLTPEQATLYRAVVSDMMEKIESSQGLARRGHVLAALTKLKQVLNHPAHFLKDGSALENRSGKLDRLGEMLEEALSEGDAALVFTQYREMGELLKTYLQRRLLQPALFFHGGLSKGERDALIERFQNGEQRVMVLTLKAGGLGINLTRANHVFHYDRWWNPAVENQATDRAFRIGQTKRVQVHKMLCLGTLEEKIDAMIESKKALTENVLAGGENWLTELSNAELRRVFELRAEALTLKSEAL